jgi:hypothetical protein
MRCVSPQLLTLAKHSELHATGVVVLAPPLDQDVPRLGTVLLDLFPQAIEITKLKSVTKKCVRIRVCKK